MQCMHPPFVVSFLMIGRDVVANFLILHIRRRMAVAMKDRIMLEDLLEKMPKMMLDIYLDRGGGRRRYE